MTTPDSSLDPSDIAELAEIMQFSMPGLPPITSTSTSH
jgi:hypothetical protein